MRSLRGKKILSHSLGASTAFESLENSVVTVGRSARCTSNRWLGALAWTFQSEKKTAVSSGSNEC